jgi:hypothetical protein
MREPEVKKTLKKTSRECGVLYFPLIVALNFGHQIISSS